VLGAPTLRNTRVRACNSQRKNSRPIVFFEAASSGLSMSLMGWQRQYPAFGCSRSAGIWFVSVVATCERPLATSMTFETGIGEGQVPG
jgi:hypothetical protein